MRLQRSRRARPHLYTPLRADACAWLQGYSSTAFALALPPDGRVVTCDRNAETMAVAHETWATAGVTDKARALATDHHPHTRHNTLLNLAPQPTHAG
jgi:hypothetical protein